MTNWREPGRYRAAEARYGGLGVELEWDGVAWWLGGRSVDPHSYVIAWEPMGDGRQPGRWQSVVTWLKQFARAA